MLRAALNSCHIAIDASTGIIRRADIALRRIPNEKNQPRLPVMLEVLGLRTSPGIVA